MMMTWHSIVEFLKEVGSIIGILVTLFGIVTGLFKPIRKRFVAWVRKVVNTDEHDQQIVEAMKAIQKLADAFDNWTEQQKQHNIVVDQRFDDLSDQYDQLKEADYYTLGNVIREVYHENKAAKRLSEHDYNLCDKAYKLYHDEWKQNGPIQAMWDEMQTWEKIFN